MPLDNRPRVAATKPLTPALSANIRARSAIAPKVANSTPTSPAAGIQRAWRAQAASPERSEEDRPRSLASNITPRSGVRTTRLGTESPTANTTPTPKDELKPNATISGLGISSPSDRPSSTASSKLTNQLITPSKRRTSGSSNVSQMNNDAKFFHANDVRTPPTASRPAVLKSRPTSFVRAASPRSSPKKNAETTDKFFRADDVPSQSQPKLMRPLLRTKNSASSVTTMPRFKPDSFHAPTSPLVNSGIAPKSKPRALSNAGSAVPHTDRRRSSSLNTALLQNHRQVEHRKSLSASTITAASAEPLDQPSPPSPPSVVTSTQTAPAYVGPPPADTILAIANSLNQLTGPLSDSTSPRSTSLTSANTTGTSGTANTDLSAVDTKPATVSRHVRGISETQGNIAPMSQAQLEAAAHARRERKVLDLEISNSSLLAINKTLEKELKKQNAELRRFKRLSRSGRLSLAPTNRAISVTSTITLGAVAEDDPEHSYLSFSEDDSDAEKSEDEEDDSYLSDENSSAGDSSVRARRRARDEKRILQDLTRHQEMLIESQKLTQSIHRCINCTDELIKDGTRALAYRVGIGDVKLGGRVLSQDDDDDENDDESGESDSNSHGPVSRQGLLSPVLHQANVSEASRWIANLQGLDQQQVQAHASFHDPYADGGVQQSAVYSP